MRLKSLSGVLLVHIILLSGCGKSASSPESEPVPISGIITINDQPGSNALVTFIPIKDTKGNGGAGFSDANGRYEIKNPQGQNTLPPGQYKVTVSRPMNKDGTAPDPSTPQIETVHLETLPPIYTDPLRTQLAITLSAGDKRSFDFSLKSAKK